MCRRRVPHEAAGGGHDDATARKARDTETMDLRLHDQPIVSRAAHACTCCCSCAAGSDGVACSVLAARYAPMHRILKSAPDATLPCLPCSSRTQVRRGLAALARSAPSRPARGCAQGCSRCRSRRRPGNVHHLPNRAPGHHAMSLFGHDRPCRTPLRPPTGITAAAHAQLISRPTTTARPHPPVRGISSDPSPGCRAVPPWRACVSVACRGLPARWTRGRGILGRRARRYRPAGASTRPARYRHDNRARG